LIDGDAISISLSQNVSSIFSKGHWLLCKLKMLLAQNMKKASLSLFPKLHPYFDSISYQVPLISLPTIGRVSSSDNISLA